MNRAKIEQAMTSWMLAFTSHLLDDFTNLSGQSFHHEMNVIERRVQAEGVSFLTKTLPTFSLSVLRALDDGCYQPTGHFRLDREGCPRFFGGLLKQLFVFDRKGENIVCPSPDVLAVRLIHQLGSTFKKIKVPYTVAQEDAALSNYRELEYDYPVMTGDSYSDDVYKVLDNAKCILAQVFGDEDLLDIIPKHGPGAVAFKEQHGEKYIFHRDDRLFDVYPFAHYFQTDGIYSPDALSWHLIQHKYQVQERIKLDPVHVAGPGRICLVPKTFSGPRIIQAEPKERQWIQQGQLRRLVQILQTCDLTRGHVNFKDQGVNRRLALRGSLKGSWATIDWSDASDLIGAELVEMLIPRKLFRALWASRSDMADLPNTGELLNLQKFAGMGSAVCFPVESVIFFALAVGAIARNTGWTFERCAKCVYVYGDDVIVPQRFATTVMQAGLDIGMRPSESKCFYRSAGRPSFRESCGCDAFGGEDITPTRVRSLPPSKWSDTQEIAAWTAMSNLFFKAGLWRAASYAKERVESVVGPLPIVPEKSGQLGWHSYSCHDAYHFPMIKRKVPGRKGYVSVRLQWNKDYQCLQYRAPGFEPVSVETEVHLSEFLLSNLSRPVLGDDGEDPISGSNRDLSGRFPNEVGSEKKPGVWQVRNALKTKTKLKPLIGV